MRRIDWVVSGSLVLLVAAAIGRGVRASRSGSDETAFDPSEARFESAHTLTREGNPSMALPAEGARPGHVVIETDADAEFVGLAGAFLCPSKDAAPDFGHAQSVFAVQDTNGLRLVDWLRERKPLEQGPDWFLLATIWLDGARGRELRHCWSPVDLVMLGSTGVSLRPERHEAVTVRVVTSDGTPVPGARVSVDEAPFPVGRFLQFGYTNDDGELLVSGLEPDRRWTFGLPEGVGPARTVVSATWATVSGESEVVLQAPLQGSWEFSAHTLSPLFRGAGTHLDTVSGATPAAPAVWTVARWIGPGRGAHTTLHLMRRADLAGPEVVRLGLRGFREVDVAWGRNDPPIDLRTKLAPQAADDD